jgi:hypothetical protein
LPNDSACDGLVVNRESQADVLVQDRISCCIPRDGLVWDEGWGLSVRMKSKYDLHYKKSE